MKLEQFIDHLNKIGWKATEDAKWSDIVSMWTGLFPKDAEIANLEAEIDRLEEILKEIGDIAHDASTGPENEDTYWARSEILPIKILANIIH